jgi:hypothetical protein
MARNSTLNRKSQTNIAPLQRAKKLFLRRRVNGSFRCPLHGARVRERAQQFGDLIYQ